MNFKNLIRAKSWNFKLYFDCKTHKKLDTLRTSGAIMMSWLSLLHKFIQQSLISGSAQVQALLVACRRFAIVRISDINKWSRL